MTANCQLGTWGRLRAWARRQFTCTVLLTARGTGGAYAADAITIERATARPTFVSNGLSAAYLVLRNTSATPDRVVAVRTPIAVAAEIHQSIKDGEIMRMRAVPALEIAAGATVTLEPGGLHVMLIGIKEPLKEGQTFPLTLVLEQAGERTIEVMVAR